MKSNDDIDFDYAKLKVILDKKLGYDLPLAKVKIIGNMLINLYEALSN
jgi:hypothetical protein